MPNNIEWKKVEFEYFIKSNGANLIIENAPKISYSKKDKEHGALLSILGLFIISGFLVVYIILSLTFLLIYFTIVGFIIVVSVGIGTDVLFILNYIKSNIRIKPVECWFEIFEATTPSNEIFHCFSYYPIFSSKVHPNKAKDIIYKLYQEEILKSRIDITQIEIYLKMNEGEKKTCIHLGYFFQYDKDKEFRDENINKNSWNYFSPEKVEDNLLFVANWAHQYELKEDLFLDQEKLEKFRPWIIHEWNDVDLKPLTEDYKKEINWNLRFLDSNPKLHPWEGDLENQTYENPNAHKEIQIINTAIEKIIGKNIEIKSLKDIEKELSTFKMYFRDLNS